MKEAIVREKYEWSDIWWDCADDGALPRVLLIGDSTAVSYTNVVIKRLECTAHVDRLSNSKGINDPALIREVIYMLGEYRYAAIHFNNGLHGWHIPDDEYGQSLRQLVEVLRRYAWGARLIWASSTPVTVPGNPSELDPDLNLQACRRNTLASEIMQEYGIPVNDLNQAVLGRPELSRGDGFHYNEDGQAVLGNKVADVLLEWIRK